LNEICSKLTASAGENGASRLERAKWTAVLARERKQKWVPSPTAAGIGMLVPAAVIIVMFLGSVVDRSWWKADRRSNELYMTPLASGLIASEAIIAVIIPLLVVLGLLHQ